MNQRLNSLLVGALSNEGRCRVSVAEAVRLKTPSRAAGLDLRLKAARLLVESCAIVMARTDGTRAVLNLDAGYDRDLGGS